jgi:hypothetical protein
MRRPWPTGGAVAPKTNKQTVFSPATRSNPTLSGAHSLGLKQHWFEVDHSSPSNARVKNEWIYTSTPSRSRWESVLISTRTTLPHCGSEAKTNLSGEFWNERFASGRLAARSMRHEFEVNFF